MLDERLVGLWSDKAIYLGIMEASDIALGGDGRGWTHWYNVGAFDVQRFSWTQTSASTLLLRLDDWCWGSCGLVDDSFVYLVHERESKDAQLTLGYEITAGRDVNGTPATLLRFDRHVSVGMMGDRFAFDRALSPGEKDPACGAATGPIPRGSSD